METPLSQNTSNATTSTTMLPSTASTKSLCVTLALHALVGAAAAAPGVTATAPSLDRVALLRPLPVDLLSSSPLGDDRDAWTRRNVSAYAGEEESDPPARAGDATTVGEGAWYYAAYEEGARCSSKPISAFESWEGAYASREDCCAVSFSRDYEACMEDETAHSPPTHDERAVELGRDASIPRNAGASEAEAEFELPVELAAMIAAARATQSDPAPATEVGDEAGVRYYPTYEEGAPCSSKASSAFESWEESHATLADCCEAAFSWDYDACMGHEGNVM